jgi:hypothetical protein
MTKARQLWEISVKRSAMSTIAQSKPRPYWHVDAKWIAGLLLVFALSISLLLYGLVVITTEPIAVRLLSVLMASAFSPAGLDAEGDIQEMQKMLDASPDGSLQPIPGLRIIVHAEDIEGLSPRQARIFFFRKFAEPLYQGGAEGLAELADDPEMRQSILEGAGLMALFSQETHDRLRQLILIPMALSLILGVLLVLFSYRFGRLFSPGCALFVAVAPCAGAMLFFTMVLNNPPPPASNPVGEPALSGALSAAAANALPDVIPALSAVYNPIVSIALGLMVVALLADLVNRMWRARRSKDREQILDRNTGGPEAE